MAIHARGYYGTTIFHNQENRETYLNGVAVPMADPSPNAGWELWVSHGTLSGTRRVDDVAPGPAGSIGAFAAGPTRRFDLMPLGNAVLYGADDGDSLCRWIQTGALAILRICSPSSATNSG